MNIYIYEDIFPKVQSTNMGFETHFFLITFLEKSHSYKYTAMTDTDIYTHI